MQPKQHTRASQLFQFLPAHQFLLNAAQWREVSSDSIDDVLADEDSSQPLWPMPYIDGKRPYGNRSYYQIDMAELLGQPYAKNARANTFFCPIKISLWPACTSRLRQRCKCCSCMGRSALRYKAKSALVPTGQGLLTLNS